MFTIGCLGELGYSVVRYSTNIRCLINGNYYFGEAGMCHLKVEMLGSLRPGSGSQMATYCLRYAKKVACPFKTCFFPTLPNFIKYKIYSLEIRLIYIH